MTLPIIAGVPPAEALSVDQLREKMNHIEAHLARPDPGSILTAAQRCLEMGFYVFPLHSIDERGACTCGRPCSSPGKHPKTKNGFKDATNVPRDVERWFGPDKAANLGVVTGRPSGLLVVDIDCYRGGDASQFLAILGDVPATLCVATGGGGYHLYFAHPGIDISCATNVIPGVDIRADGGYVVAPPSLHRSGKRYTWHNAEPIQPAPRALLELCQKPHSSASSTTAGAFSTGTRNDSLTRVAGLLRAMNLDGPAILQSLRALNTTLCNPPLAETELASISRSIAKYAAPRPWDTPKDLIAAHASVLTLDVSMLPDALAPAIVDITNRMQVPIEFVAGPVIVAAATTIGRKVMIRPLAHDDWTVVPNLWGMVVADPGSMKSPALAEAMAPLENLIRGARTLHNEQVEEFERSQTQLELKINALREKLKKGGKAAHAEQHKLADLITTFKSAKRPEEKRYKTNDTSVEKLAMIMEANPQGIMLFRDELSGWIEKMSRGSYRGDREFYLETWNGNSAYTVDRVERGTHHVDPLCLSVFGGIQPAKLRRYLDEYMRYQGDDGFLERFQVSFYPDAKADWTFVDRKPDADARDALYALFARLDKVNLEPATIVSFESEAQVIADQWRVTLEDEIANRIKSTVLRGHLSKYRSLMPSLALIFECLERDPVAGCFVSAASTEKAIKWCHVLRTHAERIYGPIIGSAQLGVKVLAEKIRSGRVLDGMSAREIARMNWVHLKTVDQIEDACEHLEDLGWLRLQKKNIQGGVSRCIHINPALLSQGACNDRRVGAQDR